MTQIADALTVEGALTAAGGFTPSGGTSGANLQTVTTVAAAGATLGTATAIPAAARVVYASVTLSSEGVKLPTWASQVSVVVMAQSDKGVKVYAAAAGQTIGAATTATTAFAVAKTTISVFFAAGIANKWLVLKGG